MITIVGKFADIQPGQTLQLTGFWKEHTSYSQQFEVTQYKEGKPATLIGIEKYLSSGLIKGIGSVTAKRIVAQFGLETLDIFDNQIERLAEVPGIAKKRIKHIQRGASHFGKNTRRLKSRLPEQSPPARTYVEPAEAGFVCVAPDIRV